MWIYNKDINKWEVKQGDLSKSSFDVYKQELSSTRFYSKCLSGATYLPVNDLNDIYETLKYEKNTNWFIPTSISQYSETSVPNDNATFIDKSGFYFEKVLNDYNLTLKNKFTLDKLIDDSVNYYYVDVVTTEQIDITSSFLTTKIDGVRLLKGHRILVKDQKTKEILPITTDPNTYFKSNYTKLLELGSTVEYEYYNSQNGIYIFDGEFLVKQDIFNDYNEAFRYSVVSKLGSNVGKQFHLSRLLNGYYPNESEPKEFTEKKNWIIRNQVDYNNLLEINYYDSIKHGTQSIQIMGVTYSIPERTISVGEFGVILNTQNEFGGISNVIRNKYKVNLFSVEETTLYYWICGEKGTLLKVRKNDFNIDKIKLPEMFGSLKSIDFLNDTDGIVVGEFNTILLTNDGGKNWNKISVSKFSDFDYNKVVYYSPTKFFVAGNNGVFIEFEKTITGYKAYKKRISKFIERLENEYLLVEDINDILSVNVDWNILESSSIIGSDYIIGTASYFYNSITDASNLEFVDGGNGFAYSAPGRSGHILKLDLSNDTITTFGNFLAFGSPLYYHGIFSPTTKKIYFLPHTANNILVIDPNNNDSISTIPWIYGSVIINPCITENGIIYGNGLPSQFFKIDTNTNIISILTTVSPIGGGVSIYSNSGFIYVIPNNGNKIYKLDPISDTTISITIPLLLNTPNDYIETSNNIIYVSHGNGLIKINTFNDFVVDLPSSDKINSLFILPNQDVYGMSYLNNKIYSLNLDNDNTTEILNIENYIFISGNLINNNFYSIGVNTGQPILKINFEQIQQPSFNIKGDFLLLTTNNNNIILYDIDKKFTDFNFIYLDFDGNDYGDIKRIIKRLDNNFYFSSDKGVYSFGFDNFPIVGKGTGIYNISYGLDGATEVYDKYVNDIFDYKGQELILSGNESLLLSHTYSLTFNDIIDSGFSDRNKSKMLFMNYDIASKLNFFRDNGEYRLPEPITFNISSSFIPYTNYFEFTNPVISGTTQSNWIDYWRDSLQTFEHDTLLGLDESTKVLISVTFSNSGFLQSMLNITSNNITNELSDIINLSPEISDPTSNRYYSTNSISEPYVIKSLYLYGYLAVLRTPTNYPVNKGDVIRLVSNNIETNLVVNKIFISSSNKYIYMYTEFNDNIIKDIKDNGCAIDNLNVYDSDNLVNKFNKHPLSIAYNLEESNSSYKLSAKFNNKTAYYNLATKINTESSSYDMDYTDPFIKFGYSPIYNIYDYLSNIDSVLFYPDKEYLAMPIYKSIPLGSLSESVAYIDVGISNNNKILFGPGLKFEWDSIFIDTFIDLNINGTTTYSTEKLLVMDKYYDSSNNSYVIEFHKKINFTQSDNNILNGNGSLDIISRRKLSQISDDLRVLNNIHRSKRSKQINIGSEYFVYDNELNFKIKTNSYTNILLSDKATKDNLSAIIYTDDKNELSMNILNLEEKIEPEINGITEYNGKVSIIFKDKHGLKTGNLISILHNGSITDVDNGCYSDSSSYDPNFFGSHVIEVLSDNTILLDIPWIPQYILNKILVSFIKVDSYLNYSPVDLIETGVDKRGRVAIELLPENTLFESTRYSLNVDFNRYRYRLFDGLTIRDLSIKYPWILEAEISNASIGLIDNELTWYSGVWECGRWFEGNWISGTWLSGDFYGGTWTSKLAIDKKISIEVSDNIIKDKSIWYTGRWFGGTWNGGTWRSGRWYSGSFNSGDWLNGIWNNGNFNNGNWKGGIWVLGKFNNGIFNCNNKPSYWLDGSFKGGDFGNGIWYNGSFESGRFGTESFNSIPSIWHGGNFLSGSFHSKLNQNKSGDMVRSNIHKYSIWYSGNFFKGDFYGGIAYNINFNGTWHGGILEDIQIIDIENVTNGKKLTLNGIFKFNIGNEITILDQDLKDYKTKVYYIEEDSINKYTYIWTTPDIDNIDINPLLDKYKVVSVFNSTNWKSGIFTNGVFNSGLWEGGIFYNGIFNGISI